MSYKVIVCGTDPQSKKGGIGFAIPGYLKALKSACVDYVQITTYRPEGLLNKHALFILKLPKILSEIRKIKKQGKSCIIYSHVGSGISLFREGVIAVCARMFGAETVMQIHSPETISYLQSPVKRVLFNMALIGVQRVFVLTPWWKKTYITMGFKKPIDIVPNPLPASWEVKASETVLCSNDTTSLKVLVMTRIVPCKGVDIVVEASPFFSSIVRVNIAGDGSLLEKLKTRVLHLKQEGRVKFHGWVSGADKQKLIDNADVFCHPTQLDAMPMNILEAMANGLPIVALNWGPISDLVPDREAGVLIEGTDSKKIANAINGLKDIKLRKKMGIEGKKWVLQHFTAQKVGVKLNKILLEIARQ